MAGVVSAGRMVGDAELERELVYGGVVLPRVVLQGARQEGRGEEERGYPEDGWRPVVYPRLEELQPLPREKVTNAVYFFLL